MKNERKKTTGRMKRVQNNEKGEGRNRGKQR